MATWSRPFMAFLRKAVGSGSNGVGWLPSTGTWRSGLPGLDSIDPEGPDERDGVLPGAASEGDVGGVGDVLAEGGVDGDPLVAHLHLRPGVPVEPGPALAVVGVDEPLHLPGPDPGGAGEGHEEAGVLGAVPLALLEDLAGPVAALPVDLVEPLVHRPGELPRR